MTVRFEDVKFYDSPKVENWTQYVRTLGGFHNEDSLAQLMKQQDEEYGCFVYSFGTYRQMARQVIQQASETANFFAID